jgi:site-specific DNA-methyltransferase (adenine-specific)
VMVEDFALDYRSKRVGARGIAVHADCFEWLGRIREASLRGVVTDPPYRVKEFDAD